LKCRKAIAIPGDHRKYRLVRPPQQLCCSIARIFAQKLDRLWITPLLRRGVPTFLTSSNNHVFRQFSRLWYFWTCSFGRHWFYGKKVFTWERRLLSANIRSEPVRGDVGSQPADARSIPMHCRCRLSRHPVLITGETGTGKDLPCCRCNSQSEQKKRQTIDSRQYRSDSQVKARLRKGSCG
jgi:hypothetical protein